MTIEPIQKFPDNAIEFKDGVPVSLLFDDVYFSKQGGWEESQFVFLEGNEIQRKWEENENSPFRIGELGFGSGLNAFVTLDTWKLSANPTSVEFVSLEGYPLAINILQSLNESYPNKNLWFEKLILSYESAIQSWKKNPTDNLWTYQWDHPNNQNPFTLYVFFGDIKNCLPNFPEIHAWYLDGFSPGKNPDMWSFESLTLMREKSVPKTSFATFSSAGFVRRNLTELGFVVEKKKGFGRKREMISGFLK